MNILYVIGNGFDKAQGLDTCYSDFYADYMKLEAQSELEEKVKSYIRNDYETWENMEIAMGEYSAKWSNVNDFRKVIKLLNARLKDYLITQNARISKLELDNKKLYDDLLKPSKGLEEYSRSLFNSLVKPTSPLHVNWVTFNYTDTFENLMGFSTGTLRNYYNGSDTLDSVLHIHGTLSDKLVLGVNNIEQISNESFRTNKYLVHEFVKPLYNAGCLNNRDVVFSNLIDQADVIVLMGTSVGVTDLFWWEKIGYWMEKNSKAALVYLPYDPNKNTVDDECFKGLWSEEYVEFLKDRMNIGLSMDQLLKRVFIGINKDFLKLRI